MGPLVSVIIPVYNVEKYLDRCVQSVVNQTYKNLEIILVDDGSPDNCPEMCERWAQGDSRIKVVHKQNAGLGMARNSGLDSATGEYVCFFDSDDYVDVSTVEKCITAMLRDNSDVAVFGCVNDYGDRKIPQKLDVKKFLFEGKSVQDELIPSLLTYGMGFGVSCCMKMFRCKAINDNSLRFKSEREIISEDTLFILELFPKIRAVSIIAENLYFYYKNEASLTNQYREDRQIKNDIFVQKALETARAEGLSENVCRHIRARYQMYTISALKQVVSSDLSDKDKRRKIKEIFRSPVLRNSVDSGTLATHKKTLRLFFRFYKFRCYIVCRIMLNLKMKNQA